MIASSRASSPSFLAAARRTFGRTLIRLSQRMGRAAAPADNPLALFDPRTDGPTALVYHLDATPESLKALVAETAWLNGPFRRVVYVTDCADFSILREHGCLFEYMPSRAEQRRHAPDAPWSRFLADRQELLLARLTPAKIINFGPAIDDFLEKVQAEEALGDTER